MRQVIIGVDPHKLSATIEVLDEHERVLCKGRYSTDQAGYAGMRDSVRQWPERLWAIEGATGVGQPLAQRLLEAGDTSSMCRPSWPHERGCSTPATTARPTPWTHTRSRLSRSAPATFGS